MILGIRISIERSMLVAEQFIQSLIRKYGKHNSVDLIYIWVHVFLLDIQVKCRDIHDSICNHKKVKVRFFLTLSVTFSWSIITLRSILKRFCFCFFVLTLVFQFIFFRLCIILGFISIITCTSTCAASLIE